MKKSFVFALTFYLCTTALPLYSAQSTTVHFEYAPAPVVNPLKGLVPYSGEGRQKWFPHSMEFSYIPLSALVTGEAQYTWEPLEKLLHEISGRGHQAIFRVYLEYPGKSGCIPEYLIKGGLKVHRYVNTNTQPFPAKEIETPEYSDPHLRLCLQDFIAAMGAKYDGDARIGFITAGLLGTWGEWHTYPRNDLWASKTVQNEVLAAYEKAFRITPVLLRYPAGENHYNQTPNADRPFGYHDDSFAWATLDTGKKSDSWFYITALTAAGTNAVEKWKTQPIGGEIRPEAWGEVFDENPANQKIQNFAQCVQQSHVSWLMDTGMFQKRTWSEERRQRAEEQVRRMGYDFFISQVEITLTETSCRLTLTIENRGCAPFYYDWPMLYELLSDNGKTARRFTGKSTLKGLLPGKHQLTEHFDLPSLKKGRYTLTARVPNPLTNGKPLLFSNQTAENADSGRLRLATVEL